MNLPHGTPVFSFFTKEVSHLIISNAFHFQELRKLNVINIECFLPMNTFFVLIGCFRRRVTITLTPSFSSLSEAVHINSVPSLSVRLSAAVRVGVKHGKCDD